MKRITLLIFGIILLVLIPVLAEATPAEPVISPFDVIATAADDYLNDPNPELNISSKDLLATMLSDGPYIISNKKPEDYATGHIPGAVNLPESVLFKPENLAKLPKDSKIVPYCYTGHTGSQVTAMLNMCGYNATNLLWGIMGWTKDTNVANKQFSNPSTDLPTETTANQLTEIYTLPTVNVTAATSELEIIRTACDNYATAGLKNIAAGDLNTLITDGDPNNDPIIISVRKAEDYAKGHIPGAVNIPFTSIAKKENLQKLDPGKKIVVYCYTGRTGSQTTAILNTLGYDAVNLLWGISGWTTDPVVAAKRFDPDTSPDYPFATGAGEVVPITPNGGDGSCG
ncbi:MAG: rhodanese-like domain-containing protein [Dehalococcoidia bacterium]